jgi:hypothetical protein
MSIAWEALRYTNHEVIIYDRKPSSGGSWWEPEIETRDLHSHRAVFKNAFVNTKSIFEEMDIEWNEIFVKNKNSVYGTLFASMGPKDYWALTSLATRVLTFPETYRKVTLKEALGSMSQLGRRFIETLSFQMDGVGWDTLSAFEFVQNFNHVGLSIPETQKVSGKVMSDAMQKALEAKGATFVFDTSLKDVDYRDDGFIATFSNNTRVDDGLLIMCVDHNAAIRLIKGNWGPSARDTLTDSAYECINVLIDYDEPTDFKNATKRAMDSEWTILPHMLEGGKTLSCVLCYLTEEILTTNPDVLKTRVMDQLGVSQPSAHVRIGWGADWDGIRWRFSQSSGVLSTRGQLPFFGKSSGVAMCGMMSNRHTPYASIEAATEVGRMFCHQTFGSRTPFRPLLITQTMILLIVFMLIIINYEVSM